MWSSMSMPGYTIKQFYSMTRFVKKASPKKLCSKETLMKIKLHLNVSTLFHVDLHSKVNTIEIQTDKTKFQNFQFFVSRHTEVCLRFAARARATKIEEWVRLNDTKNR